MRNAAPYEGHKREQAEFGSGHLNSLAGEGGLAPRRDSGQARGNETATADVGHHTEEQGKLSSHENVTVGNSDYRLTASLWLRTLKETGYMKPVSVMR